MADYHSLLTRAVANLPNGGTPATREAIYVRARKALIEQLRSLRPPLPESDIAREANALDAAIAQIEARYGSPYVAPSSAPSPPAAPSASPPGGKPGASPPPSPKPGAPTAPAQPVGFQRPVTPGSPQSAPMAGSPAPSASPSRPPSQAGWPAPAGGSGQPSVPLRTPPPTSPPPRPQPASAANPAAAPAGKLAAAAAPEAPPGRPQPAFAGARPASSLGAKSSATSSAIGTKDVREDNFQPPPDLAKSARSRWADEVHGSAAPPVVATRPDELVESAAAPEVPGEFDRPGAGARQDFEAQRPVAPGNDDGKPKPWLWIAAAVALGVVLAVAGAAILMRQKPQDLAIKPPVEATAPRSAAAGKDCRARRGDPGDPCRARCCRERAESGSIGRPRARQRTRWPQRRVHLRRPRPPRRRRAALRCSSLRPTIRRSRWSAWARRCGR